MSGITSLHNAHTSIPQTRKPALRLPNAGAGGVALRTESAERGPGSRRPGTGELRAPASACGNPPPTASGSPDATGFLAVVEPPRRSSSAASSYSGNHPTLPAQPGLHLPRFEARASRSAEAAERARQARGLCARAQWAAPPPPPGPASSGRLARPVCPAPVCKPVSRGAGSGASSSECGAALPD